MTELHVLSNTPVELETVGGRTIELQTTTPPVDGVISVNGKQGVVVLTASDIQGAGAVPSSVRQAIYTLLNNAAYATTGLTDEIAVVESWAEEVTSLTLNKSTLSLSSNTPQTVTATVVPSGSTVTWSSSDTDVATVVAGVVTGVGNGECVITATAGDLSATCAVTVSGFATLESISAVYTQSGTVYDTDSLDSLKADLVVTATYSDTSTTTVPSTDYTLSGTLAVGTSTITVVYHGQTDTFSVTVTESVVPSIYRQVPYVASIGSNNPLVNTGVTPTSSGAIYVEIGLMFTAVSGSAIYMIGGNSGGGAGGAIGFGIGTNADGTVIQCFNGIVASVSPNNGESIVGQYYEATATFTSTSASISVGALSDTKTGSGRSHTQPTCLFGIKRKDSSTVEYASKGRIYYARVTNGGDLILDLIPCVRISDNAAGFYDVVNENFITATGLTAGE